MSTATKNNVKHDKTWFLWNLNTPTHDRAVIVAPKLPKAMTPHLFSVLKGDRTDLSEGFLDGHLIPILNAYWKENPVPALTAHNLRDSYEECKQEIERTLDSIPLLEQKLNDIAKQLIETHGTSPIHLFGELHHPSCQRASGRFYFVPTRGGRKPLNKASQ